ncbi:MAG: protocatechuate 3,4-dioxygenase subunit alpha [Solirubrobacteraceae bacterium]
MPPLHTPSQTIGPFFHVVLAFPAPERFTLSGSVLDGAGSGVADALVEIWDGRALARCHTDAAGRFAFALSLDAIVAAAPADEAPHVVVSLFARGLLGRIVTRCYLPGDEARLSVDPFLQAVPEERRATLVAISTGQGLRFDLCLQGERETVFHVW